jgi:heme/copper-type cytochrome/quinol oxidase subunit 2
MKYCQKCKNYFDDALLRFCLNDGAPLAEIKESDSLWSEGETFIRETHQQVLQETRKRQFRTMLKTIVMMLLVIMIMSVITLQSWIYLSKPETETVQKTTPSPTVESLPTSTPEIILVGLETPTPTPKPIVTPTPTPIPTPVTIPSVTVSPTVKITATPPVCRDKEKLAIQNTIKKEYLGYFAQSIANIKKEEAHAYFLRNYERLQAVRFGVNATNYDFSFRENNCKSLLVDFYFEFAPDLQKLPKDIKYPNGTMTFSCTKQENIWVCK